MDHRNAREWRRLDVDIPAEGVVLSKAGGVFPSRVLNLNPDGVCFTAPDTLRVGDEVALTFDLQGEGKTLLRVRAVWAGQFEIPREYRVGGKFEGTLPGEKDKFLRFYHVKLMTALGG